MDHIKMSSITVGSDNFPVTQCEFIEIPGAPTRIYYRPLANIRGFDFAVVTCEGISVSGPGVDKPQEWFDSDTQCTLDMHGVAYFDGIRHLYIGDEATKDQGYIYCPNLGHIMTVLAYLKQLEDRFCDADR